MNFFDRINEWLDRTEVSWVNLLTKVLPILVPIIPAMQTKRHVVDVLGYGEVEGWIAAGIVEFFGYAAMYKMIQFAEHNRRYSEKNRAPFGVAVMIYAAYLAIIIVFNVIPEVYAARPPHIIWMNALFAVLSVPAGALTAISALHTERKEAMKRKPNTEHPAEHRTPNTERTPSRTPEHRTPNTERTPIPQPSNEHPFQIPNTDRAQRVRETAKQLGANASMRDIQAELRRQDGSETGWSLDTISKAMK